MWFGVYSRVALHHGTGVGDLQIHGVATHHRKVQPASMVSSRDPRPRSCVARASLRARRSRTKSARHNSSMFEEPTFQIAEPLRRFFIFQNTLAARCFALKTEKASMWPDQRLCNLMKIRHPIIQAPMVGPATPALAGAVKHLVLAGPKHQRRPKPLCMKNGRSGWWLTMPVASSGDIPVSRNTSCGRLASSQRRAWALSTLATDASNTRSH